MYEGIDIITPSIFHGETVCSSQMDLTSDRVNKWASLAMMSLQIYKLQCLVKLKDNERFQFQHDDNIACMKRLCIKSKLPKNRNGFYSKVKHFQFKETRKWRGQPKEVHVSIPPASPHNETTNSVAAKVILSLLVMFGVLKKMDTGNGSGDDNEDKIKKPGPSAKGKRTLSCDGWRWVNSNLCKAIQGYDQGNVNFIWSKTQKNTDVTEGT